MGQSGEIGKRGRSVYFDAEDHPASALELSEVSGRKGEFFAAIREAAATWAGRDPILVTPVLRAASDRIRAMFEELLRARPTTELVVELSADALEQYREQGFTRIERLTSEEELEWLRGFYDRLFEERQGALPGGYFDLSRPYESGGGHMIRKPPRVGESLPWHQDEAHWDPAFEHEAVGVWMPLDPATLESGCMHFIPGSHRRGVMRHRHLGDDPNVHALVVDEAVDESQAVLQPIPVGGASFHHCRLLHRSGPNRTDRVRRAYANEFTAPRVRRRERAERPWFDQTREAWSRRSKVDRLPTEQDA